MATDCTCLYATENMQFRKESSSTNLTLKILNGWFERCLHLHLDQELISVRDLVFDLAQLTCQKRFDCRNAIIWSSETSLDTSLSEIVVAVLVYDIIFIHTLRRKRERQKREKNTYDIRQLLFLQHISSLICYINLCNDCRQ